MVNNNTFVVEQSSNWVSYCTMLIGSCDHCGHCFICIKQKGTMEKSREIMGDLNSLNKQHIHMVLVRGGPIVQKEFL